MHCVEVSLILTLCSLCGISTTLASCKGGETSSNQCSQSCELDECKCNTTNDPKFDNCDQKCLPPNCFSRVPVLSCIAEKNCSQLCQPGSCDMTCNAQEHCEQRAENNGAKKMSCFSKRCEQSCMSGSCEVMHCEAEVCLQTCGSGGCTMNCTESVKKCSQSCTANMKCILECRAEICHQKCSGPSHCVIVNEAPSSLKINLVLFVMSFILLNFV